MLTCGAVGVVGIIWRMLADDPAFDTSNYHGIAERYWGLLHADGRAKAAFRWFVSPAPAAIQVPPALP
jgi:hypothetical protein